MVSGLTRSYILTENIQKKISKKSLSMRLKVVEELKKLKKIGGMEFYDVQLSYVKLVDMEEVFVPD